MRIAKGGNPFCYPEYIGTQMIRVFADLKKHDFLRDQPAAEFARRGAHLLAELNSIHPFREGNGRTQLAFFAHLAELAGHPLQLQRLEAKAVMVAMIASFGGDESPLRLVISELL